MKNFLKISCSVMFSLICIDVGFAMRESSSDESSSSKSSYSTENKKRLEREGVLLRGVNIYLRDIFNLDPKNPEHIIFIQNASRLFIEFLNSHGITNLGKNGNDNMLILTAQKISSMQKMTSIVFDQFKQFAQSFFNDSGKILEPGITKKQHEAMLLFLRKSNDFMTLYRDPQKKEIFIKKHSYTPGSLSNPIIALSSSVSNNTFGGCLEELIPTNEAKFDENFLGIHKQFENYIENPENFSIEKFDEYIRLYTQFLSSWVISIKNRLFGGDIERFFAYVQSIAEPEIISFVEYIFPKGPYIANGAGLVTETLDNQQDQAYKKRELKKRHVEFKKFLENTLIKMLKVGKKDYKKVIPRVTEVLEELLSDERLMPLSNSKRLITILQNIRNSMDRWLPGRFSMIEEALSTLGIRINSTDLQSYINETLENLDLYVEDVAFRYSAFMAFERIVDVINNSGKDLDLYIVDDETRKLLANILLEDLRNGSRFYSTIPETNLMDRLFFDLPDVILDKDKLENFRGILQYLERFNNEINIRRIFQ